MVGFSWEIFIAHAMLLQIFKEEVSWYFYILGPLIRALGISRKIFITPLARYWVSPCCNDPGHVTNYHTVGYLPRLGELVYALRNHVRDSYFTRKAPNIRVLCPNRMIGMGQRRIEQSDDEAAKTAVLWGGIGSGPPHGDCLQGDGRRPGAWHTEPRFALH